MSGRVLTDLVVTYPDPSPDEFTRRARALNAIDCGTEWYVTPDDVIRCAHCHKPRTALERARKAAAKAKARRRYRQAHGRRK